MEKLTLAAQTRTLTGKKTQSLRDGGLIPAVLYGHNVENKNLQIEPVVFEKLYQKAGESTLVELDIDEKERTLTLIQDVSRNPLSGKIIHIDFRGVSMNEKIDATIPLKFIGEPKAVKEFAGILVKNVDEIEVRCLPSDLIHEIEVDLAPLVNFDVDIKVKDIKLPTGIELLSSPDDVVAVVTEPLSEEELKAMDEKPVEDVSAIKVEEKGKKEEESATK